jgi:transcriptional regulator with AAA-type ATPase domain
MMLRVSPLSDLPILITGETETGKALFARAIHQKMGKVLSDTELRGAHGERPGAR